MKKTLALSIAILAVLWSAGVGSGREQKNPEKRQARQAKVSEEQKAWQEELKTMTPEQQKVAKAKRAFELAVAPWREVRLIALQEKAVKTLAAIDLNIAAKEKVLNRRLAALEKGNAGPQAGAKKQAKERPERKGKGKKKGEGN